MWAWSDIQRRIIRESIMLAAFLVFGLFLLPVLIYLAGEQTLGPYRQDGGLGVFLKDFYGYLPSGKPWPWLLVTGPYLIFITVRILIWPWRAGKRRPQPVREA